MPTGKRLFDLGVAIVTAVAWIPALVLCCLAVWAGDGRPIFYVSARRISASRTIPIVKFRTMVRNAALVANRSVLPVEGQRFLNIARDSPLFTRIGRLIEACCLTEIPQILHVLRGEMTLVGNRPLPEDVVRSLGEVHPSVEARFLVPAGLAGPVQLVGRENLADGERLAIETAYCQACATSYSWRLDALILILTVIIALRLRPPMSARAVSDLIARRGASAGASGRSGTTTDQGASGAVATGSRFGAD